MVADLAVALLPRVAGAPVFKALAWELKSSVKKEKSYQIFKTFRAKKQRGVHVISVGFERLTIDGLTCFQFYFKRPGLGA